MLSETRKTALFPDNNSTIKLPICQIQIYPRLFFQHYYQRHLIVFVQKVQSRLLFKKTQPNILCKAVCKQKTATPNESSVLPFYTVIKI